MIGTNSMDCELAVNLSFSHRLSFILNLILFEVLKKLEQLSHFYATNYASKRTLFP